MHSDLAEAYLATIANAPSASSARLWVADLVQFLGTSPITAEVLSSWRAALIKRRYAPASINKAISTVRAFLKYLRVRQILTVDSELVSIALEPLPVPHMVPPCLTVDEIKTLCLKAEGDRHTLTYLALGLLTGMRPSEIARCKPADHVPARGLLVFASKTGRQRVVPLHDNPLLAMLLSGAGHGDDPYTFGTTIYSWNKMVNAALGRTLDRKVMRSTHATYLASSGKVSEFDYCSRMGHTVEVANNYYRSMVQGVSGSTVSEWLGAQDELAALVRKVVSSA